MEKREQTSVMERLSRGTTGGKAMNGVIYLVGLVVIVMAILSFIGLH